MSPIVSIIMGSTSDLPVMEKAAQLLNDLHVPFEMNALSAHRTPEAVEEFAKGARKRGIKVIIAAAGMAAALPGVIAAQYHTACNRRAHKRLRTRWSGCALFHHSDASGHPCGHRSHQRSNERSYSCRTNACIERQGTGRSLYCL